MGKINKFLLPSDLIYIKTCKEVTLQLVIQYSGTGHKFHGALARLIKTNFRHYQNEALATKIVKALGMNSG